MYLKRKKAKGSVSFCIFGMWVQQYNIFDIQRHISDLSPQTNNYTLTSQKSENPKKEKNRRISSTLATSKWMFLKHLKFPHQTHNISLPTSKRQADKGSLGNINRINIPTQI